MPNVLIIEDDHIIANIYRSRLEKEGFKVEIAPDGQSGFYRIHESRPDALLLDLMLPKMDGLQILRKIRAQKQFEKTPVIVFTNAYVPNMINDSYQAGANQVFNKAALTPRQIVDALHHSIYAHLAAGVPKEQVQPHLSPNAFRVTSPSAPPTSPPAGESLPLSVSPAGPTSVPPRQPSVIASGFPLPSPPISNAKAPAPPATSQPAELNDEAFQAELLRSFLAGGPKHLAVLRGLLRDFLRSNDEPGRKQLLFELYRKVHAINGNAAIVSLHNISQMCAALEALLKELYEKPRNITASTMRTVAHSIDFVAVLFENGPGPSLLDNPPPRALVVDDEIISRRAVTYALEKANLPADTSEDPKEASRITIQNPYDLIILDVNMPDMDGFELCSRLREAPPNQNTPVIFVTGLTDFESRARSNLSGGNDLIAKPFLFIELAVKALTFVMKGRLAKQTA